MKRFPPVVDNVTLDGTTQESEVFQLYTNQFAFQHNYAGTSLSLKVLTSVDGVDFVENTDLAISLTADEVGETRVNNVVKGEFCKFEFIGDGVLTIYALR